MTRDQIATRYRGKRNLGLDDWWEGIQGGESNRAFVERIAAGFDNHLAGLGYRWEDREGHRIWWDIPKDGTIGIVCHAGTTGASVAHLLAIPQVPWSWERFRLWHTGIAVLETVPMSDGVIFAMSDFNNQEHLRPDERSR